MPSPFHAALAVSLGLVLNGPSVFALQRPTPDSFQDAEERGRERPNDPELHFTIATQYFDMAYRYRASEPVAQLSTWISQGLAHIDRALALKPAYREALIYKSLLFRLQSELESDPVRRQALIQMAHDLREKARALDPPRRRP